MLGPAGLAISGLSPLPAILGAEPGGLFYIEPAIIITLCVLAGIGTVLLLPSKLESAFRGIGGTLMLAAVVILAALGIQRSPHHMGVYFWIFSLIALAAAVRVVTHSKPVYAALYFVLTVFATAGLFILLSAEFMAVALVIIYAGAILITYVFVIMLASQASEGGLPTQALAEYDTVSRDPLIAAVAGFALMGMTIFVIFDKAEAVQPPGLNKPKLDVNAGVTVHGGAQELGTYLFQNQTINLELAGLILTLSMVGAIIIARKRVINLEPATPLAPNVQTAPMTPLDDSPHSIPVYGTTNPRQKDYPET